MARCVSWSTRLQGMFGVINELRTCADLQQNPELDRNILPRICDVIQSRLQEAYMSISERNSGNSALKHVALLNKRVTELKSLSEAMAAGTLEG